MAYTRSAHSGEGIGIARKSQKPSFGQCAKREHRVVRVIEVTPGGGPAKGCGAHHGRTLIARIFGLEKAGDLDMNFYLDYCLQR